MKLITILSVTAPDGGPVAVAGMANFFDRPVKLRKAVLSLDRWGLILHDPFKGVARLLSGPVLRALACGTGPAQPVLFNHERPLDEGLAAHWRGGQCAAAERVSEHSPRVPEHSMRVLEHGPAASDHMDAEVLKPPEPVATHAFHASMPAGTCHENKLTSRLRAACQSCNAINPKLLHDQHDVGELAPRSAGEILDDILLLAPGLTPANILNWYERITREDAELVNAAVRELKLQRRHITNPAGFINAMYLRGIRGK